MQDVRYALSTLERMLADSGLDGAQKELRFQRIDMPLLMSEVATEPKCHQDPYFRTAVLQSTPVKEFLDSYLWFQHTQKKQPNISNVMVWNLSGGRPFSARSLISFPISWRRSWKIGSNFSIFGPHWLGATQVFSHETSQRWPMLDDEVWKFEILRCWERLNFFDSCQKVTKQFRVECEKAKRDLLRETWRWKIGHEHPKLFSSTPQLLHRPSPCWKILPGDCSFEGLQGGMEACFLVFALWVMALRFPSLPSAVWYLHCFVHVLENLTIIHLHAWGMR